MQPAPVGAFIGTDRSITQMTSHVHTTCAYHISTHIICHRKPCYLPGSGHYLTSYVIMTSQAVFTVSVADTAAGRMLQHVGCARTGYAREGGSRIGLGNGLGNGSWSAVSSFRATAVCVQLVLSSTSVTCQVRHYLQLLSSTQCGSTP
jgi:hypothetical protein